MKIKVTTIILILVFSLPLFGQLTLEKREFRGAWIALVRNEDWPSEPGLTTDQQKHELNLILDELQSTNINAVFFQIRPECDAIYQSNFEPWSYWLSGTQGVPPNPFYDPLQYAIDEAHKRGMELHAWFNPYRVVSVVGTYPVDQNHISITHPDWIIEITDYKFLNPGLPEVRDYTVQVIMDVVNNYKIDGVHLDDYFYPYPAHGITTQDTGTFSMYPRGFADIGDWRRDNVHLLIQLIGDSIHAENPHIKYGVSPFGIWKNGVPAGITGLDAYNVIYCDAVTWIQNQWLDYLIPQLYWPFGGGQDYGTLLPWWAAQINERHLYSGMGLYKAYPSAEYGAQIDLNRSDPNCFGSVFFKSSNFLTNQIVTGYLRENHYKYKAILPVMNWKSAAAPNAPFNLRYEDMGDERGDGLVWDIPDTLGSGEPAFMYAAYKLDSLNFSPADLENPENIAAVSGTNFVTLPPLPAGRTQYYFGVTSLSRNYVESSISNIIQVDIIPPGKTDLAFPVNGAVDQPEDVLLKWFDAPRSSFSKIQISEDPAFTSIYFEKESIRDTFIVVSGFSGQTTYYWRIASSNFAGEGEYSDVWNFKTGFPIPPVLSDPPHTTTNVSVTPTFKWFNAFSADSYNLQVALGNSITPSTIVVDTVLSDTACTINTVLQNNRVHSWIVSSSNPLGFGGWSDQFAFKTEVTTGLTEEELVPDEFKLYQNFPNPFNPVTKIEYIIPEAKFVSLKIYDVLGRELFTLVNEEKLPGKYEVNFDGSQLSSGVYFYKLEAYSPGRTNEFISIKKLVLLK